MTTREDVRNCFSSTVERGVDEQVDSETLQPKEWYGGECIIQPRFTPVLENSLQRRFVRSKRQGQMSEVVAANIGQGLYHPGALGFDRAEIKALQSAVGTELCTRISALQKWNLLYTYQSVRLLPYHHTIAKGL